MKKLFVPGLLFSAISIFIFINLDVSLFYIEPVSLFIKKSSFLFLFIAAVFLLFSIFLFAKPVSLFENKISLKIKQNSDIAVRLGFSAVIRHHILAKQKKKDRTIHFVHRDDIANVGDSNACPADYFQDFYEYRVLKHDISNINFYKITRNDVVILGGGGLFDNVNIWNVNINKLFDHCDNVIAWAVGFNTEKNLDAIKEKINFEKFKLLSIRDYGKNKNELFVQCPTCMIKTLNKAFKCKRRIGVVCHKDHLFDTQGYESITNRVSLGKILKFIGESEVIITNSYHAYYWATLMNKKVILRDAFSDKFNYLKYKPVFYSGNLEKDISEAKIYDMALNECREQNLSFYNKVVSML